MAFMVFFSSCCVCGGKLCHSLFKLYHILSVVHNQNRFFLCLPEQQHIQQIFHMGLLLQGFHEPGMKRFLRGVRGIVGFPYP